MADPSSLLHAPSLNRPVRSYVCGGIKKGFVDGRPPTSGRPPSRAVPVEHLHATIDTLYSPDLRLLRLESAGLRHTDGKGFRAGLSLARAVRVRGSGQSRSSSFVQGCTISCGVFHPVLRTAAEFLTANPRTANPGQIAESATTRSATSSPYRSQHTRRAQFFHPAILPSRSARSPTTDVAMPRCVQQLNRRLFRADRPNNAEGGPVGQHRGRRISPQHSTVDAQRHADRHLAPSF